MAGRQPLIIWGSSGHAAVIADAMRLQGGYEIVGFIDDLQPNRRAVHGGEVLGSRHCLPDILKRGVRHLIIAIGDCRARMELSGWARGIGFEFAVAKHPSAIVAADVTIGAGSVLAAGAIINPGSRLGTHVIVNTGATVDHDCLLGDFSHIGPGCHLAGSVTVGAGTFLGVGCSVLPKVALGRGCVVGAGSVVVKAIADMSVAYGVPARVKKQSNWQPPC